MIWFTYYAFFLKLASFMYYGQTLLDLEKSLKSTFSLKIPESYIQLFQNDWKFADRLASFTRLSLNIFTTYFCFYMPFSDSTNIHLLYPGPQPCNTKEKVCFFIIYTTEVLFTYVSVFININLECMYSKLITICCCLFEVVKQNFINIDFNNNEKATEDLKINIALHIEVIR